MHYGKYVLVSMELLHQCDYAGADENIPDIIYRKKTKVFKSYSKLLLSKWNPAGGTQRFQLSFHS
jgi:hypothetical protein